MREDGAQGEIAPAFGLGLAVDAWLERRDGVGKEPVLEAVERGTQRLQRRPYVVVRGQWIAVDLRRREHRVQATDAFVELALELGRQMVGAMELAHHAPDRGSREHG